MHGDYNKGYPKTSSGLKLISVVNNELFMTLSMLLMKYKVSHIDVELSYNEYNVIIDKYG